jgi:glutamyl-tRNA reductase
MNLVCLGINHRTAPLEVREKVWFSNDEVRAILPVLREGQADECVLVSTCNRTELYYLPKPNAPNEADLWSFLASFKKSGPEVHREHFYRINSLNVVKHLFKVASAVDSMVIGDVQILNQIKEAYAIGQELHSTGTILNRLFTAALHVGKRSRTETEIGEGAVSISYAAAELASKIFDDLSRRTALLIGAGETGELAAKHLSSKNIKKLWIANRTPERAEALARQLQAEAMPFDRITSALREVDIIITSVSAPGYILTAADLSQLGKARGGKPLFLIDLGVPRNIEPSTKTLENVFLHDIDTLKHITDKNLAHREAEIPKVQEIILHEVAQYNNWVQSLEIAPTIEQLQNQFEAIRRAEIEKHRHHFKPEEQEQLEMVTRRIVNKILHTPMVNLRNGSQEEGEDRRNKINIVRYLFGLDKKDAE